MTREAGEQVQRRGHQHMRLKGTDALAYADMTGTAVVWSSDDGSEVRAVGSGEARALLEERGGAIHVDTIPFPHGVEAEEDPSRNGDGSYHLIGSDAIAYGDLMGTFLRWRSQDGTEELAVGSGQARSLLAEQGGTVCADTICCPQRGGQ